MIMNRTELSYNNTQIRKSQTLPTIYPDVDKHPIVSSPTVVDKQSPPIGYLSGKLMDLQDFFRILLSFSKEVKNTPSEVFPTTS